MIHDADFLKHLKNLLQANLYLWSGTGSLCKWDIISDMVKLSHWLGNSCLFFNLFCSFKLINCWGLLWPGLDHKWPRPSMYSFMSRKPYLALFQGTSSPYMYPSSLPCSTCCCTEVIIFKHHIPNKHLY